MAGLPKADQHERLPCFLYGLYMDPDHLKEAGVAPPRMRPARLPDWRLTFSPLPDLVPAPGHRTEGFLAPLDARDLERLRAGEALGQGYEPIHVEVHTAEGHERAIALRKGTPPTAPATADLAGFLDTCRRLALPPEHIDRVMAEAQRLAAHDGAVGKR